MSYPNEALVAAVLDAWHLTRVESLLTTAEQRDAAERAAVAVADWHDAEVQRLRASGVYSFDRRGEG